MPFYCLIRVLSSAHFLTEALKHKILVALDTRELRSVLLTDLSHLLNRAETNLLTGIFLPDYFERKTVGVNKKSTDLASKVTFEIEMEREAAGFDMEFEMFRGILDDEMLRSLSTVADLMVVDRKMLQRYCGEDVLVDLVRSVSCPVLVLPHEKEIGSLVMVHDGTTTSVQAVKHFLNLFNPALRALPLSVLVRDPTDKNDIQNEKVFIEYLKLFFRDIGIQLMNDEPVDCLVRNMRATSEKPLLLVGGEPGNKLLHCNADNRVVTDNAPTFIFKG